MGFNNIELITDRPLEVNLARDPRGEAALPEARRHRLAHDRDEGRLAAPSSARSRTPGCDGLELNFGCPHGMCERGMGSAVGQEPKLLEEITALGEGVRARRRCS